MANQRFSNRFIIVLLVAFIGLVLPSLVSSAVTPGVTGLSGGERLRQSAMPLKPSSICPKIIPSLTRSSLISFSYPQQSLGKVLLLQPILRLSRELCPAKVGAICTLLQHHHHPNTTFQLTHLLSFPLCLCFQGITILYPLKSIGGIVVSMTANQLKTIKDALSPPAPVKLSKLTVWVRVTYSQGQRRTFQVRAHPGLNGLRRLSNQQHHLLTLPNERGLLVDRALLRRNLCSPTYTRQLIGYHHLSLSQL
ncbi:hypothetical protein MJO29_013847 [Puccinia striiformis f. sp. tritici]|nr:hypothetical protein MJO29_013847 [Puccinia striiformis f. sp. tritici]